MIFQRDLFSLGRLKFESGKSLCLYGLRLSLTTTGRVILIDRIRKASGETCLRVRDPAAPKRGLSWAEQSAVVVSFVALVVKGCVLNGPNISTRIPDWLADQARFMGLIELDKRSDQDLI